MRAVDAPIEAPRPLPMPKPHITRWVQSCALVIGSKRQGAAGGVDQVVVRGARAQELVSMECASGTDIPTADPRPESADSSQQVPNPGLKFDRFDRWPVIDALFCFVMVGMYDVDPSTLPIAQQLPAVAGMTWQPIAALQAAGPVPCWPSKQPLDSIMHQQARKRATPTTTAA